MGGREVVANPTGLVGSGCGVDRYGPSRGALLLQNHLQDCAKLAAILVSVEVNLVCQNEVHSAAP